MSRDTDFRGKPLHDNAYNYRGKFIEQYPIEKMGPLLQEVWDKGVLAIKWDQYTPRWNDGDTCEFIQGEIKVTKDPAVVAAWAEDKYYEGPDEDEYYHDYDEGYILGSGHREGLTYEDYDTPVDDPHFLYAIESEFGSNATVVITPEETYIFEYECGY